MFNFVYVSNPGYLNWDSQLHKIKWVLKYFSGSGIWVNQGKIFVHSGSKLGRSFAHMRNIYSLAAGRDLTKTCENRKLSSFLETVFKTSQLSAKSKVH